MTGYITKMAIPRLHSSSIINFLQLLITLFLTSTIACAAPVAKMSPSGSITGRQVIDVRAYGARPDSGLDDTAALQKALNNGSGKTVHFSKGRYRAFGLEIMSNTHVVMDQGAYVERIGSAAYRNIFDTIGTLGSPTALISNAPLNATSVFVSKMAGLTVGKLVMIQDATYAFSNNGRNMEINEIAGISGLTVILKHPLVGNYTTTAKAELVPFIKEKRDIIIENANVVIPAGGKGGGYFFQRAYNVEVKNCNASGMEDQSGVNFWNCAHSRVIGGVYSNGQKVSSPGMGYGFAIANASHNCEIRGVTTKEVRENSISIGSKYCKITECTDTSAYDNSYNTHADGNHDCEIINNTSTNSKGYGIVVSFERGYAADKRIRISGNKIINPAKMGIYVDADSDKKTEDIVIENNTILRGPLNIPSSYQLFISKSIRPIISNNTLDGLDNTKLRGLLYITKSSDVKILNNTFRNSPAWGVIHLGCTGINMDGNNFYGISAHNIKAESGFSTGIVIRNNKAETASLLLTGTELMENNAWEGVGIKK